MRAPEYLIDVFQVNLNLNWNDFIRKFSPDNYNVSTGLLISRLGLFLVAISGSIFLYKIILAGYGYLTSAGDQTKIQNASKEIVNALVGLIITVSAFFIVKILEVIYGVDLLK